MNDMEKQTNSKIKKFIYANYVVLDKSDYWTFLLI